MELLDQYFEKQKEVHTYFGYSQDWRILPLDDCTDHYWRLYGEGHWRLYGEGPGKVRYAKTLALLDDGDMKYYEFPIYTQRHLPKWVYRADDYTMICVDTQTDGNKLLMIFDNKKEDRR